MSFKKTGETQVYKKPKKGFTKRTAEKEEPVKYTVDDLVADSDKGVDPYQLAKEAKAEEEAEAE